MLKYREFSVMFLGILISSDGNAEDGARFGGTAFGGWQCWHTVHKRCPWFILIPCQYFWRGVVFLYFTYCTSVVLGEDLQERGRVKGSDDFFGRWVCKKLHAYGQLIQIPTRNYLKKSVGMFRIVWMFHVDNWWLMIFDYQFLCVSHWHWYSHILHIGCWRPGSPWHSRFYAHLVYREQELQHGSTTTTDRIRHHHCQQHHCHRCAKAHRSPHSPP